MKSGPWLTVWLTLTLTLFFAQISYAQDLSGPINLGGDISKFEKTDFDLGQSSLMRAANKFPFDAATFYERMSDLSLDESAVTRGSHEAEIYRTKSPAVVYIFTDKSMGSGTFIDTDGTILTNWHVLQGYPKVGVVFKPKIEGEEISPQMAVLADVIKIDEVSDLALVRAKQVPAGLKPIELGTLDDISVGDDVHAIGHPTGEYWTYTRGFVSQVRRGYDWDTGSGVNHNADVVQTQTPINPGNSGGPLLSSSGNLIGVNSFSSTRGEALHFAVAVSTVKQFIESEGSRAATRTEPMQPSANCGADPIDTFRDEENNSNVALFDLDCDGRPDGYLVVPDDPRESINFRVDTDGDGEVDELYVDEDRDGEADYGLFDTSGNGQPDLIAYYRDGEEEPYKVEKISG